MRLYLKTRTPGLLVLAVLWGLMPGGCAAPPPPPDAILSGTWVLTTDDPTDLSSAVLFFDTTGLLTSIRFIAFDNTAVVDQPLLNGFADVTDSQVIISETFDSSNFNFAGTLNFGGTEAVGTLSTVLNFTFFQLTLDQVPATMTKQ